MDHRSWAADRRNFGLGDATNLHQRVGLADEGHEGHLQLRHAARNLERSLVEVERLLWTTELNEAVAEEGKPAHQGRGVAVRFGDLDCLAQIHDCGVRVALQKSDKAELAVLAGDQ